MRQPRRLHVREETPEGRHSRLFVVLSTEKARVVFHSERIRSGSPGFHVFSAFFSLTLNFRLRLVGKIHPRLAYGGGDPLGSIKHLMQVKIPGTVQNRRAKHLCTVQFVLLWMEISKEIMWKIRLQIVYHVISSQEMAGPPIVVCLSDQLNR